MTTTPFIIWREENDKNVCVNKCHQKAFFSMVWGWRKGEEVKSHTLFCTYQIWEITGFTQSSAAVGKPFLLIIMHKGDEMQRLLKDNGLKRIFLNTHAPILQELGLEECRNLSVFTCTGRTHTHYLINGRRTEIMPENCALRIKAFWDWGVIFINNGLGK